MSNYGPPGEQPDPWADRTVAYPAGSVPQSVPPAPQSVPPAPQYQPGSAAPGYPGVPQNPQYQPPYGQAQPAAYEPTQYQPNYPQGGYQQGYDQGYQQPVPPKKSSTVLILSIVLGIVVVGAIVAGVLLYQRNNSTGTASGPPANVGECVVSNGQPAPNVGLNKAACGPGSFKIVKIITGTSDQTQCSGVAGANTFFAYKWSSDPTKSYVLCMASQ